MIAQPEGSATVAKIQLCKSYCKTIKLDLNNDKINSANITKNYYLFLMISNPCPNTPLTLA